MAETVLLRVRGARLRRGGAAGPPGEPGGPHGGGAPVEVSLTLWGAPPAPPPSPGPGKRPRAASPTGPRRPKRARPAAGGEGAPPAAPAPPRRLDAAEALRHAAFVCASVPEEEPEAALAEALARYFASAGRTASRPAFPPVQRCEARVGEAPAARWGRAEAEAALALETNAWGTVDVVWEGASAGLYRLNVAAGRAIPPHAHRVMRESELVPARGLRLLPGGRPLGAGEAHRWGRAVHGYEHPAGGGPPLPVLCVDVPPFQPSDEVPLEAAPGAAPRPPPPREAAVDDAAAAWRASPGLELEFPGCFSGQRVRLRPSGGGGGGGDDDDADAPRPAAVAGLLLDAAGARLLLVRHRTRGWELPGGKVEQGEAPAEALARECAEEAGAVLADAAPAPLADYGLAGTVDGAGAAEEAKDGAPLHLKRVFVARVARLGPPDACEFERRWVLPRRADLPPADECSPLLVGDCVLDAVLALARARSCFSA